jgi:CBS domain containing-hemolysin-like protein
MLSTGSVFLAILVVTVLLLINAVYVCAEFAAVSVRRSRIKQLVAKGHPLAVWLLPFINSPAALDRYIAACQIGITVSSLVMGAYAQATFAVWLAPLFANAGGLQTVAAQSTSVALVLLLLTGMQVIFAELVPKSLALRYPTQSALYTLLPMVPSLWFYRPFIRWLNGTGLALLRLLGAPQQGHQRLHSSEEIELLIAESREGGLIDPDEQRRLQRALRLNMLQARQLMIPRRQISALDVKTPLEDVANIVATSPYSRLPVYRDSVDNVVGMLRTKDLVQWMVDGLAGSSLESLIRPLPSVHESVKADQLLRQLRERRAHQALVVDEFGGTAGLVTLEDVLAEFLGNVGDEFKAGEPMAEPLPDGRIRLPGGFGVTDAEVLLGTTWETEATTVAGLVTEALGHLPTAGELVIIGAIEFEVERVRDRTPESIVAKRHESSESEKSK